MVRKKGLAGAKKGPEVSGPEMIIIAYWPVLNQYD